MWSERYGIVGAGYEGKDASAFINGLASWQISTVIDVRLNPISRKKGLSKRALAAGLEEAGMSYLHLPALGNPRDNREGFALPGSREAEQAHARYRELLTTETAEAALQQVAELALTERVAVVCFEESERCCHRSLVIDAAKKLMHELVVA
jgi:uncharacterized protein (DUF488 family)